MNSSRLFAVVLVATSLVSACTKMQKNAVAPPNTAVNNGLDDGKVTYGVIPEETLKNQAALEEEFGATRPADREPERLSRSGVEASAAGCGAWTTLYAGMSLYRGMALRSPGCRYVMVLQNDFHLVIYDLYSGRPIWWSDMVGGRIDWLYMQPDGNLVGYAGGTARFHANSYGHGNARAVLQDDGNFVVYNQRGTAMWSTKGGGTLQARGGAYKVGGWGDGYCAFSNGPGEAYCWIERSSGRCPAANTLGDWSWNQWREADHGRCQ